MIAESVAELVAVGTSYWPSDVLAAKFCLLAYPTGRPMHLRLVRGDVGVVISVPSNAP
jgi:hypothetical protein